MRSALLSLLFACFLAVGISMGGAAAPPPIQLCGVCGGDIDGSPGGGTLDIYLELTGESQWVERVPIEPSEAERYRDDPEALTAAVEAAWAQPHVTDGDDVTKSMFVENATVVVTYTVPDMASQGVGDVWLVEYFYRGGTSTRYHIGGEQLTIHLPEGHVLTNSPSGGETSTESITWEGNNPSGMQSDFDPETLLTYSPGDGFATTTASVATVAVAIGPLVLRHTVLGAILPTLVLVVGAAATVRLQPTSRLIGPVHRGLLGRGSSRLALLFAAVGILGTIAGMLWFVLVGGPVGVLLALGSAGYALLAGSASRLEDHAGASGLLVGTIAIAVGFGMLSWMMLPDPSVIAPTAFFLCVLAFLALGYGAEGGMGIRLPLGIILLAPFAAVAAIAPVYVFGLNPVAYGVLLLPTAVIILAVGYPLSVLGRLLILEEHGS